MIPSELHEPVHSKWAYINSFIYISVDSVNFNIFLIHYNKWFYQNDVTLTTFNIVYI